MEYEDCKNSPPLGDPADSILRIYNSRIAESPHPVRRRFGSPVRPDNLPPAGLPASQDRPPTEVSAEKRDPAPQTDAGVDQQQAIYDQKWRQAGDILNHVRRRHCGPDR